MKKIKIPEGYKSYDLFTEEQNLALVSCIKEDGELYYELINMFTEHFSKTPQKYLGMFSSKVSYDRSRSIMNALFSSSVLGIKITDDIVIFFESMVNLSSEKLIMEYSAYNFKTKKLEVINTVCSISATVFFE